MLFTSGTPRAYTAQQSCRNGCSEQLGNARFKDINPELDDLKIVAADVRTRAYKIYSKKNTPDEYLANAVTASASIPIFFHPYSSGAGLQVDGGILSNYPAFLFAQSSYPTLGFRLNDLTPPSTVLSPMDYFRALIHTMTDAHDKARELPTSFTTCVIETPKTIPAFKFDLSQDDADRLFEAGRSAAASVDWSSCSSDAPIVSTLIGNPTRR